MQLARALVAVGLVSLLGVQRSAPPELDARQILERTAKVYRECKTYRDSGAAKTVFIGDSRNRTVTKPFTTAFVRPDRFRFEYLDRRGEEEFDRYLIWKKGQDVRRWWDLRPGVQESTLDGALSAAKGVSSNSSYAVPSLLLGPIRGWGLVTDLANAARKADGDLDGSRCFVIQGGTEDEPKTLWIDQQTFLLRRIDEQNTFDDFRTEETTTYEPVLDEEIPESLLVFDPPVSKPAVVPADRRRHRPTLEDLDAPRILERMAQVYATCSSYRDSGVAKRILLFDGRRHTEKVPFTTAFVRPERFRYEARVRRGEEEFDRYLFWKSGRDVRSWFEDTPRPEQESVAYVLGFVSAATFGSTMTIPSLLWPAEMPSPHLLFLPNAERMEDDLLDGLPCFVLQGSRGEEPTTLWIDRTSYLLRRIDTVGSSSEYITTYEPVVDEEIPESLLVFDPPVPEER
jgi:outer membrane lipoprotein-sorting protein